MTQNYLPIKSALINVQNKTGLVEFTRELQRQYPKLQLIASKETANHLAQANIFTTPISQYTCFPDCFNEQINRFHPIITGGLAYKRGKDDARANEMGIPSIDLVVWDLNNPEKETPDNFNDSYDVVGLSLIQLACKNYTSVACITDTSLYPVIIEELLQNKGSICQNTREHLAVKAMNHAADYQAKWTEIFTQNRTGEKTHRPAFTQGVLLKSNPQNPFDAWVFQTQGASGLVKGTQCAGSTPSYKNYCDGSIAYKALRELLAFDRGAVIVKNGSIVSFTSGNKSVSALETALNQDKNCLFGGVLGLSYTVDTDTLSLIEDQAFEMIIAPKFTKSFITNAEKRFPHLKLIEVILGEYKETTYQSISGGILVKVEKETFTSPQLEVLLNKKIATKRKPTPDMMGLYSFGLSTMKLSNCNQVTIVREYEKGCYQLLGLGEHQPNRFDALDKLAIPKALEALKREGVSDTQKELDKCLLVTNGFFPIEDSLKVAASYGLRYFALIADSFLNPEIHKFADNEELSLLFTGN